MSSTNEKWTNLLVENQDDIENALDAYLKEDKRCKTLHICGLLKKEEYEQMVAADSKEDRGNFVWEILYNKQVDSDFGVLNKVALALTKSAPEVSKMLASSLASCKPAEQGPSRNVDVRVSGNGKVGATFAGDNVTIGNDFKIDQSEHKVLRNDTTVTTTSTVQGSIGYMKSHPEEFKQWAVFCPPKHGNGPGTWEEPSSKGFQELSDGCFFSKPYKAGEGWTLLINNKFDNKPGRKRVGAEKDTESIQTTFPNVTVAENVASEEELEQVLDKFKAKVLAQKVAPAYIVVIIGSHGCNNHEIQLENGNTVNLFRHIVSPLSHEYAGFEEYGEDKPRLFFVNACQNDPDYWTGAGIVKNRCGPGGVKPEVPVTATNFFVGFSTLPSQPSYRCEGTGSLYLQAICRHLKQGQKLYPKLKIIGEEIKKQKTETPQISSFLPSYDFPLFDFKF